MRYRGSSATLLSGLIAGGVALGAGCHITRGPAVQITMKHLEPLVAARINGHPAQFMIDSGAYWSMISPQTRRAFGLPDGTRVQGMRIAGVNGSTRLVVTTARRFEFLNEPFRHALFIVGGNDLPSGAAGVIGGAILQAANVEYDFGNGLMRFVTTTHCKGLPLAYWAPGQLVGRVELQPLSAARPYLIGNARVDGRPVRVLFDSGAPHSILALSAARRVGIKPQSAGVNSSGWIAGISKQWKRAWLEPMREFQIGGVETVSNMHIRVSDFHLYGLHVDMVLGADFFLSNHILVAIHRHVLYFTYNGGPVFDLGHRYQIQRPGAVRSVVSGTGAASVQHVAPAGTSLTANVLMRRGMALAADGRNHAAIAVLSGLCRREPADARCRLQRGRVYAANKQPALALADFDAAIRLNPQSYQAHLARAALLLAWRGAPRTARIVVAADLNIAALLTPDSAMQQMQIADLYARLGRYADALRAVDLWIHYRRHDALFALGLSARCWIRAQADRQLHQAQHDCDLALERRPNAASTLDARGLLLLRLQEPASAIVAYDAALRARPGLASALYGRGLAELRTGELAAGHADIASALDISPGLARRFALMHLRP